MEAFDAKLEEWQGMAGIPADQIKTLIVLGLSSISGISLNALAGLKVSRNTRLVVMVSMGTFFQLLMFRMEVLHIYFMSAVAYLMLLYLPRDVSHKTITAWVLAYNSVLHLKNMINCYGCYQMDVLTYLMILMSKLWALGWAYRDGSIPEEKLTES